MEEERGITVTELSMYNCGKPSTVQISTIKKNSD